MMSNLDFYFPDTKCTQKSDVNPTKLKMVNDNDQDTVPAKTNCNGTVMNGGTAITNGLIPNGHNIMEDIDEDEPPPLEEIPTNEHMNTENSKPAGMEGSEVKEGGDSEAPTKDKVEDVIVIQDAVFTIKIQPPGTEVFDLQVSK